MNDRGRVFRALHEQNGAFAIPNPWDVRSARIRAGLGFKALATTSAGMIAHAVYSGHRFAREFEEPDAGDLGFLTEPVMLG